MKRRVKCRIAVIRKISYKIRIKYERPIEIGQYVFIRAERFQVFQTL